jgi:hypothetical protein
LEVQAMTNEELALLSECIDATSTHLQAVRENAKWGDLADVGDGLEITLDKLTRLRDGEFGGQVGQERAAQDGLVVVLLEDLRRNLGFAEWPSPEQAEQILADLIGRCHPLLGRALGLVNASREDTGSMISRPRLVTSKAGKRLERAAPTNRRPPEVGRRGRA